MESEEAHGVVPDPHPHDADERTLSSPLSSGRLSHAGEDTTTDPRSTVRHWVSTYAALIMFVM